MVTDSDPRQTDRCRQCCKEKVAHGAAHGVAGALSIDKSGACLHQGRARAIPRSQLKAREP
jgi:hypothetical protein